MPPSACGVCNNELNSASGTITCAGECGKVFHQSCVKESLEGKTTRSTKPWKCGDCRGVSSTNSSAKTSASEVLTKDFLVRLINSFKEEVFKELKVFKEELAGVVASTSFISEQFETINTLVSDLTSEVAALKKENYNLRTQNAKLDASVDELQDRIRSLEQYSRRMNIEVSGVPVSPQEDMRSIVKDLGAALGVQVEDSHVTAAHRVPTYKKDRTPSLVIQFNNKTERDTWIQKFRETRGSLTANKVNSSFPKHRIYINEHLSPDNKLFLSKLKRHCQEIGFTYVWCREGKFFVRKANGEKCFRINSIADMNKLK